MRPLPLLLTTLLTIISLSPETQAQSKPTPAATAATSTKSIDQLVTKINADIKAKRVTKQEFEIVFDERTQTSSFRPRTRRGENNPGESIVTSGSLLAWHTGRSRGENNPGESIVTLWWLGKELIKIEEGGKAEETESPASMMRISGQSTHYFRSDGSLAAFEEGYEVQNGEDIDEGTARFYFDPTGKKVGEKATEKQVRKVKTVVLNAKQRKHLVKNLHFMNISQVPPYLSRRWKNN